MAGKFELNQAGIDKMLAEAKQQLEAQLNPRLQDAVRTVRDRYSGEDAETVYTELVDEIEKQVGAKFEPNEANLRQIAEAIVKGELTG